MDNLFIIGEMINKGYEKKMAYFINSWRVYSPPLPTINIWKESSSERLKLIIAQVLSYFNIHTHTHTHTQTHLVS